MGNRQRGPTTKMEHKLPAVVPKEEASKVCHFATHFQGTAAKGFMLLSVQHVYHAKTHTSRNFTLYMTSRCSCPREMQKPGYLAARETAAI